MFIESDFDTTGTTVTFDTDLSSICIMISTFEDQIIEDPESFNVTIVSSDISITTGPDAQVTIGDSNMMDILVSLDQISYTESEGNSVNFCVQLIYVVDIRRSVQLQILTASDTAEGTIKLEHCIRFNGHVLQELWTILRLTISLSFWTIP